MKSRWRAIAQQVIADIRLKNPNDSPEELLRKIDSAYPFGERANHPYKCWLSERKQFIRETKT